MRNNTEREIDRSENARVGDQIANPPHLDQIDRYEPDNEGEWIDHYETPGWESYNPYYPSLQSFVPYNHYPDYYPENSLPYYYHHEGYYPPSYPADERINRYETRDYRSYNPYYSSPQSSMPHYPYPESYYPESYPAPRKINHNKTNKVRKKTIINPRMVSDYLIDYNPNKISEFKTILLNHDDFISAWLCESIIKKLTNHLNENKELRNELLPIVNFAFFKIDEVIKTHAQTSDMCTINHIHFLFRSATRWIDEKNKEKFIFGLSVDTCQTLISNFENSTKLSDKSVSIFMYGISKLVNHGYITDKIIFNNLDHMLSYLKEARSIDTTFLAFEHFIRKNVFANTINAKSIKRILLSLLACPDVRIINLEVSVITFAKLLAGNFVRPDSTMFDDYVEAVTGAFTKNLRVAHNAIADVFFIFRRLAINGLIISPIDSLFLNKILPIALGLDDLSNKDIFAIIFSIKSLVEKKLLTTFESSNVEQLFMRYFPHPTFPHFALVMLHNYFIINSIKGLTKINDQVVKNLIDYLVQMPSIKVVNLYYAIFCIKRSGEEGLLTQEVTNHCLKTLITRLSKFADITPCHIYAISSCLIAIDQLATINLGIDEEIEYFISNVLVLSDSKYATHVASGFFYIARLVKNNFIDIKNSSLKNLISSLLRFPHIRTKAIHHVFNGIRILSEVMEGEKINELCQAFIEGITYLKENNDNHAYKINFLTSLISMLSSENKIKTLSENKPTDIDILDIFIEDDQGEGEIFSHTDLLTFEEGNYYASYYSSSDSEDWEDFAENLYSSDFLAVPAELDLSARNNRQNLSYEDLLFEDASVDYLVFGQNIEGDGVGNTCPFAAVTDLKFEQTSSPNFVEEVKPALPITPPSLFFTIPKVVWDTRKRKQPETEQNFPANKKLKLEKNTNISTFLARLSFTQRKKSLDLDIPTLSPLERKLLGKLYINHKKVNGKYRLTVQDFGLFNEFYQRMMRKHSMQPSSEEERKSFVQDSSQKR